MVDIIHRLGISAPADTIYKALTTLEGLAGWWTQEVSGEPQVGGKIEFLFRTKAGELLGKIVMEIVELIPQKLVLWRCVEGPSDWIGTNISFEFSEKADQVIVFFSHKHWREAVEFMGHCSMKWATFLLSLRDYAVTGKGKPSPDDIKIDDFN